MSLLRTRLKQYDEERRVANFTRVKQRSYEVARHAELSDVDLERGDTLPDDANYEIVEAHFAPVKDKNSNTKIALVTAIKYDTE